MTCFISSCFAISFSSMVCTMLVQCQAPAKYDRLHSASAMFACSQWAYPQASAWATYTHFFVAVPCILLTTLFQDSGHGLRHVLVYGCQQLFGKPNCEDVSGPAQSVKSANLIPVVIEREDCETHYTYAMTAAQHPLLSIKMCSSTNICLM